MFYYAEDRGGASDCPIVWAQLESQATITSSKRPPSTELYIYMRFDWSSGLDLVDWVWQVLLDDGSEGLFQDSGTTGTYIKLKKGKCWWQLLHLKIFLKYSTYVVELL